MMGIARSDSTLFQRSGISEVETKVNPDPTESPRRGGLAAFAAGATMLQFCPRLPPLSSALAMVTLVLTAAALLVAARASQHRFPGASLTVVAACLFGF
jgi:hypothetical protein